MRLRRKFTLWTLIGRLPTTLLDDESDVQRYGAIFLSDTGPWNRFRRAQALLRHSCREAMVYGIVQKKAELSYFNSSTRHLEQSKLNQR